MSDSDSRFRPSSVLFALILLSPLFWIPGYGYDGIRLPIVWGLATLLLGMQAYRAIRGRRRPAPLLVAASLLLAAQILSLIGARTPGEAVAPLIVLFAGVAVFTVARSGTVAREFVSEGVPILLSITSLALATIGIVQATRGLPVVSAEGNTNYAGALAGMLLPATFAFACGGKGPARRVLPALAAAALFALLLMTKSRGGWVGAIAGTLVAGEALYRKRVSRARLIVGAGLVLVAIPLALRGTRQLSESGSGSVIFRLEAWKGALGMIAARPILGVGVGNFAVEYPRSRTEAEFRASHAFAGAAFKEVEDAHSIWVQSAVETGLLGMLALLLVVYVGARLWRYYVRTAEDSEKAAFLAGLGGGAAAYLVAGLFNTISIHLSLTILFWAFLGMIELVGGSEGRRSSPPAGQWAVALPLAAAIAGAVAAWTAWTLAISDREFTQAMSTRDPETRARHLERAAEGHPAPWRIRHELAGAYWSLDRLPEAIAAEREVVRLRPHYVEGLDRLAVMMLGGKGDEAEAEQFLRKAIAVAPYYYLPHYNLGSLLLRRKKVAAARAEFGVAVKCNDRHASSEFSLGETFALEKDSASALPHFRRARELGINAGALLRQEHPDVAADPAYAELHR